MGQVSAEVTTVIKQGLGGCQYMQPATNASITLTVGSSNKAAFAYLVYGPGEVGYTSDVKDGDGEAYLNLGKFIILNGTQYVLSTGVYDPSVNSTKEWSMSVTQSGVYCADARAINNNTKTDNYEVSASFNNGTSSTNKPTSSAYSAKPLLLPIFAAMLLSLMYLN
ncbi:hypothetical protein SJAG_02108 [Schizosaccharomyces japonicus yFS275]|uniref:Uncharacterized protein n=1 Tax=Schizosaccharomyces japonicus (strain yFS275 / FY16936) TaxID=402676 RepID=B6JZR3_SCHJY|nr:hypothetical protein SJAG_02108 [Schizosaccharomyces japonicus yFS275]EEB07031.1 hypothetical protein SJAG_02108 [Schizosaccharomyces japonicus yFS275]